jgi:SAM-dependent methyltransferase
LNTANDALCIIPDEVFEKALRTFGKFSSSINLMDAKTLTLDHLDAKKSINRAYNLERYTSLSGKKVLEIGSGYGVNLIVWSNFFSIDGCGIEPESIGFESSYIISRELFSVNGLDPQKIINAVGENLPFPDNYFDIVYSANALEHTQSPLQVLSEAIRVLKPGGYLHFELPNFLSYFEGHYMVFQPPLFWRWVLPFWIRWIVRRDPGFAKTLRTEINPRWCYRVVKLLSKKHPIQLVSLGEELFRERLRNTFQFEAKRLVPFWKMW